MRSSALLVFLARFQLAAETGGFEPPEGFNPLNTLAPCRFRPLSHVSSGRNSSTFRRSHQPRASVRAVTERAPAARRVRAQSCSVAPVVQTSSMRRTARPLTTDGSGQSNASRMFSMRPFRSAVSTWLAVWRTRMSASAAQGMAAIPASACARRCAWLYPRSRIRAWWRGTGTRSIVVRMARAASGVRRIVSASQQARGAASDRMLRYFMRQMACARSG